jgi:ABC-type bacteriocin/lantibiotic exporter with double-glycine peptidase domain
VAYDARTWPGRPKATTIAGDSVFSRIQDAIAGAKTVKLSGAEDRETAALERTMAGAYASYAHRGRIETRYRFAQAFLTNLGHTLVLGYGGWKVVSHQLTPAMSSCSWPTSIPCSSRWTH